MEEFSSISAEATGLHQMRAHMPRSTQHVRKTVTACYGTSFESFVVSFLVTTFHFLSALYPYSITTDILLDGEL